MAKSKPPRVFRIVRWMQDHEPPGKVRQKGQPPEPIAGPLRYYSQPRHSGQGHAEMVEKWGLPHALLLKGLFDLMCQRSAGLPFERRGWCLGRTGALLPCAKLATEIEWTKTELAQSFAELEFMKWLRPAIFRPNRRPLGPQRCPVTETERERERERVTERATASEIAPPAVSVSDSDSAPRPPPAALTGPAAKVGDLLKILGSTPGSHEGAPRSKQHRADVTTLGKCVEQTRETDWHAVRGLAAECKAAPCKPGQRPIQIFVYRMKAFYGVTFGPPDPGTPEIKTPNVAGA